MLSYIYTSVWSKKYLQQNLTPALALLRLLYECVFNSTAANAIQEQLSALP